MLTQLAAATNTHLDCASQVLGTSGLGLERVDAALNAGGGVGRLVSHALGGVAAQHGLGAACGGGGGGGGGLLCLWSVVRVESKA